MYQQQLKNIIFIAVNWYFGYYFRHNMLIWTQLSASHYYSLDIDIAYKLWLSSRIVNIHTYIFAPWKWKISSFLCQQKNWAVSAQFWNDFQQSLGARKRIFQTAQAKAFSSFHICIIVRNIHHASCCDITIMPIIVAITTFVHNIMVSFSRVLHVIVLYRAIKSATFYHMDSRLIYRILSIWTEIRFPYSAKQSASIFSSSSNVIRRRRTELVEGTWIPWQIVSPCAARWSLNCT